MAANVQQLLQLLQGSETLTQTIQGTPAAQSFAAKQLETFEQLLQKVTCFDFGHAAMLASKLGETCVWEKDVASKLIETVTQKAATNLPNEAAGEALSIGRRMNQDFTSLACYLTPSLLASLASKQFTMVGKAEIIGNFASKMGLQCPSEQTFAALVGIINVVSNDIPVTSAELHDRLRQLKPIIKGCCECKGNQDLPYIRDLPCDRSKFLDSNWGKIAFSNEQPVESWEDMPLYKRHWKLIPLRVTNFKAAVQPFQRLVHTPALPQQVQQNALMQFLWQAQARDARSSASSSSGDIPMQYFVPQSDPASSSPVPILPALPPAPLAIQDTLPAAITTVANASTNPALPPAPPLPNSQLHPLDAMKQLHAMSQGTKGEDQGTNVVKKKKNQGKGNVHR